MPVAIKSIALEVNRCQRFGRMHQYWPDTHWLAKLSGSEFAELVLAQEQEVLALLVFGERGRVAPEVRSARPACRHCGRTPFWWARIVFEFDKLLEL